MMEKKRRGKWETERSRCCSFWLVQLDVTTPITCHKSRNEGNMQRYIFQGVTCLIKSRQGAPHWQYAHELDRNCTVKLNTCNKSESSK